MNTETTTTVQAATHGASHTTTTVHIARLGGYDGKRLLRACGMSRTDTAYLYATEAPVTCKRCLGAVTGE